MKPRSSASRTSSGYTSSRTNSRIHSSFFSNSGSVEKSHVMPSPPSLGGEVAAERGVGGEQPYPLVDHACDGSRQRLVERVGPLAPPVEHEVVAKDGRVLVQRHGHVPVHLAGVDAVQGEQLRIREGDRPARTLRV